INTAMFFIEEEMGEREEAEEVRVFYVASTRAKEKMIYFLRKDPRSSSDFSRLIRKGGAWPSENEDSLLLGETRVPVTTAAWKEGAPQLPHLSKAGPLGKMHQPIEMAKQVLKREREFDRLRLEKLFISPSHLADEADKWRVIEDREE